MIGLEVQLQLVLISNCSTSAMQKSMVSWSGSPTSQLSTTWGLLRPTPVLETVHQPHSPVPLLLWTLPKVMHQRRKCSQRSCRMNFWGACWKRLVTMWIIHIRMRFDVTTITVALSPSVLTSFGTAHPSSCRVWYSGGLKNASII